MDVPSGNPKQRSSPANDSSPSHTPSGHNGQAAGFQQPQQTSQPYPYPVNQQPQGAWQPSIAAQPFYPNFYQNHPPQQPYPHMPQGAPYFDPANAQLAQWAYHQMMMNAQQFPHMSPQQSHHSSSQRNGAPPTSSADYFAQNQIPNVFNPFPSGTPPPPAHRNVSGDHQQQPSPNGQYPGFHPYRRPTRQGSQTTEQTDWRPGAVPNPPYARPDASGSTSSVNSSHSSRQRTNSNQSGKSGHNVPSANGSVRSRTAAPATSAPTSSRSSSSTPASTPAPSSQSRIPPHNRSSSSSSSNSSATSNRPAGSSASTSSPVAAQSSASTTNPRPARPSPLSQGNFTAAEKRMSRDDSDLAAMLDTPSASMIRSGGLKGRLRRALSFNAAQALKEEEDDDDDVSIKASQSKKPKTPILIDSAVQKSGGGIRSPDSGGDDASTRAPSTVQTKKRGRAASLFSSRLNASTDNISLSSTVSSASVMIRKLGSMGKLARRNSLAGITSLFKEKDKDKDGDKKGKKKDKKGSAKGSASEASVSHVTAELDRTSSSDWSVGGEMNGLSPAAKLARQHTLKTNAEAAAQAKAQQEAQAAATVNANAAKVNGASGVPSWEKNTSTRHGSPSPVKGGGGMRVNEDGTRVIVEDDDDESDDGHYGRQAGPSDHTDGWDDDEDWGEGDEEEDVTIRQGLDRISMEDDYQQEDHEAWATDVRRSVERARTPAKGILKRAFGSYDQQSYNQEHAPSTVGNRLRSNSYNAHPGQTELGPLARIPSPDPDHIDGLVRHPSHSSQHGQNPAAPSLPPLSFDTSGPRLSLDAPRDTPESPASVHAPVPEKASSIFNHPNLNSSAPALSTIMSSAPTLTHRSATAPTSKRLAFASNLSVYDTFSANVYDRRSEPATWSRLTPQLAQRIKEELNSYKMEEMEVHAASRIHTQFFV
ncbi:hypothetical protein BDZ89DRAFT_1143919 [Hymenopellis radicata]|nr:hypothetical protein BDZ89DRAFT_1143919 [Hymenopellis radicata]